MTKIEQDLKQLFENNFDCYTIFESGNMISEEMAMTKDKFIEVVSNLLIKCKLVDTGNSNCTIFDVSQ